MVKRTSFPNYPNPTHHISQNINHINEHHKIKINIKLIEQRIGEIRLGIREIMKIKRIWILIIINTNVENLLGPLI